jgi:hypothetical protein
MWTLEGFIDFMRRPGNSETAKMDELLQYVRQLQGREEFTDDFSMVELAW